MYQRGSYGWIDRQPKNLSAGHDALVSHGTKPLKKKTMFKTSVRKSETDVGDYLRVCDVTDPKNEKVVATIAIGKEGIDQATMCEALHIMGEMVGQYDA